MAKRGAQVIGEAEASADKPEHRRIDYKWIVLSVTTIGALMAAGLSLVRGKEDRRWRAQRQQP